MTVVGHAVQMDARLGKVGWAAVCGSGAPVSATTAAPRHSSPPQGATSRPSAAGWAACRCAWPPHTWRAPPAAMRCTGGLCQGKVVWSWGLGCPSGTAGWHSRWHNSVEPSFRLAAVCFFAAVGVAAIMLTLCACPAPAPGPCSACSEQRVAQCQQSVAVLDGAPEEDVLFAGDMVRWWDGMGCVC